MEKIKDCAFPNIACARHGKCDECIDFHKQSIEKPLPFCQREENKEKCPCCAR